MGRAPPAILALIALAACDEGRYAVVVRVPGGVERPVRVQVALLRSCADLALFGADPPEPLQELEVVPGRPSEPIGSLPPGQYALYARVWEAGCQLYAVGCQAFSAEAGGRGTIQVVTTEIPTRGCGADESCQDERCVPAETRDAAVERDAGPPDAAVERLDAAPDGGVPAECPESYVEMDGSRYRLHPLPATWLAAELDCENDALGAHLIVVDDVNEHFLLHALAIGWADSWVAYTDRRQEGTFRWLAPGGLNPDNDECFWGAGGVSNADGSDCVVQRADNTCGDWFVVDCDGLHSYVCECDDHPADRSAY